MRRRTQNDTLGGRGRRDDPLYRALRLLIAAHERLSEGGDARLSGLSVIDCPQRAERYATEPADDLQDASCPPELRRLGRILARCYIQIVNWHHARASNGPTETINNLIERVTRGAFGLRRFAHYRISALLYVGKPNWTLLPASPPR